MPAQRNSPAGPLELYSDEVVVYRVGYAPEPFAWPPWQYANDGRFDGRWDDPDGRYRTLYVGEQLLGCLLEVLADFRPDLEVLAGLAAIVDDDGDAYPTLSAGVVPRSWLEPRRVASARLVGEFVDVRAVPTIATLRSRFAAVAAGMDLPDLDASALKARAPRTLTQAISGWLYREIRPPVTGVCFASRFGDAMTMWAVFEQPGEDGTGSAALHETHMIEFDETTPALIEAMHQHGLVWG